MNPQNFVIPALPSPLSIIQAVMWIILLGGVSSCIYAFHLGVKEGGRSHLYHGIEMVLLYMLLYGVYAACYQIFPWFAHPHF